jgi:hypothetical protein
MTTLEAVLQRRPSFAETIAALGAGFRDAHGMELRPGGLDREEEELMAALVRDKYATEEWTRSGRGPQVGARPHPVPLPGRALAPIGGEGTRVIR